MSTALIRTRPALPSCRAALQRQHIHHHHLCPLRLPLGHNNVSSPPSLPLPLQFSSSLHSLHSPRRPANVPVTFASRAPRRITDTANMSRAYTTSLPLYTQHPLTPPPTPSHSASSSPTRSPLSRSTSSTAGLTLRVAAGGSGKGKRFQPERDIVGLREYERSLKKGGRMETGQDSFFLAQLPATSFGEEGGLAVGVADGVGGYIESGFDSADFSHTLCEYMAAEASTQTAREVSAQRVMRKAYDRIVKDNIVQGGGSTACVGVFKDGVVDVANLGDSGYFILRLGRTVYTSTPQTHAFNTPYQLSIIPPPLLAQAARYGGIPLHDLPRDADVSKHPLYPGDVLLFATDGVLDNLFSSQILSIVTEEMLACGSWVAGPNGFEVGKGRGDLVERKICERVVRMGKKRGEGREDGPFAKEVQRVFPGEGYRGGKPDDVGVVVVVVEAGQQRGRAGRL
ncbi:protein serine/threonine phosphatase 2C [Ascobolus immersus RN42]|uniref:Protein phosphatase n=1 Tax=Ascobolus immersus RN42 TaxID=1160509 RepID=A0A3N4IGA2_ASCIM|nr:protein serine/threonine phosphatase 2C [Ascobolus immersus RN42]